jgi:hypothetical protein
MLAYSRGMRVCDLVTTESKRSSVASFNFVYIIIFLYWIGGQGVGREGVH